MVVEHLESALQQEPGEAPNFHLGCARSSVAWQRARQRVLHRGAAEGCSLCAASMAERAHIALASGGCARTDPPLPCPLQCADPAEDCWRLSEK